MPSYSEVCPTFQRFASSSIPELPAILGCFGPFFCFSSISGGPSWRLTPGHTSLPAPSVPEISPHRPPAGLLRPWSPVAVNFATRFPPSPSFFLKPESLHCGIKSALIPVKEPSGQNFGSRRDWLAQTGIFKWDNGSQFLYRSWRYIPEIWCIFSSKSNCIFWLCRCLKVCFQVLQFDSWREVFRRALKGLFFFLSSLTCSGITTTTLSKFTLHKILEKPLRAECCILYFQFSM